MSERLRVVIADDEPKVCVVVQKCIHWDELELELTGIAHNGKDLLDRILETKPDLVVTDIDMPEMNGLELIETVRKSDIDCKFIIISGYRQFEYAHKALKNNVEDYLLKPIDEQELNESLERLKMTILHERMQGQDAVEQLISKNKKDKENIHRIFLNQIMYQREELQLDERLIETEYGLSFGEGVYQAVFAKLDDTEHEDLSEGLSSIQTKLISIFKKIFENQCKEILVLAEPERILFGIYYDEQHKSKMNENFKTFYEYGKNIVELFIGFSLTVGVSGKHYSLKEFPIAFEEAKSAITCRVVDGIDRTIFYEQLAITDSLLTAEQSDQIHIEVVRLFEILDVVAFRNYMSQLYFVDNTYGNALKMFDISKLILTTVFARIKELKLDVDNCQYRQKVATRRFHNAVSIKEMKTAVTDVVAQIMEELEEKRRNQKKKPVRDAIQYIEKHYAEDISLEVVAGQVNLNPVYFSNIFKKEIGENFVDYLHKYRMEIAKVALREEDTPIINIAYNVGYHDAKYFSKLFKKYVGIKPTDYRKIYG